MISHGAHHYAAAYITYVNQMLSFGNSTELPVRSVPAASFRGPNSSRSLAFLLFSFHKYTIVPTAQIKQPTCSTRSVIVADVYRGAVESAPYSHVARIAPAFALEVRKASDVARRRRGEVLLAVHVPSGATIAYVPGTAKKSDP